MSSWTCNAIVIGASAGGRGAIKLILSSLREDFPLPILVVQHLHSADRGAFAQHMNREIEMNAKTACDKERIKPGHVYFAPANYHMLVEQDETLALSLDIPPGEGVLNWGMKFARPDAKNAGQNLYASPGINQWQNGQLKLVFPREVATSDLK